MSLRLTAGTNVTITDNVGAGTSTVAATGGGAELPAQVSAPEIAAGTETALRSYSPADVVAIVDAHAPAGGAVDDPLALGQINVNRARVPFVTALGANPTAINLATIADIATASFSADTSIAISGAAAGQAFAITIYPTATGSTRTLTFTGTGVTTLYGPIQVTTSGPLPITISSVDGNAITVAQKIPVEAVSGAGVATALDDLSDVTITTPSNGQVLKYNGSAWVNDTDATGGTAAWGGITGTLSNQTDLDSALGAKAPLASPTFTGAPKSVTPAWDSNSTDIATGAYVDQMLIQQYLMVSTNPASPITLATADKCYLYSLNANVVVNGPGAPAAARYEEHIYGFTATGADRTVTLGTNLETGAGETGKIYTIPLNRTRWFKWVGRSGATGLWSEHTGLAPVTSTEKTAGTATQPRAFTPADVKDMIATHGLGDLTMTALQTGNYTAAPGQLVLTDSSGGAFTVTLPPTPAVGARVAFLDVTGSWGTNAVTLGRNGVNIEGAAANWPLNTNARYIEMLYADATRGWMVRATISPSALYVLAVSAASPVTLAKNTHVRLTNATSTVTMPLANTAAVNFLFNAAAGAATIARNGTDTLNGATSNLSVPVGQVMYAVTTGDGNWSVQISGGGSTTFATAAEIRTGTEPAKAIAPDTASAVFPTDLFLPPFPPPGGDGRFGALVPFYRIEWAEGTQLSALTPYYFPIYIPWDTSLLTGAVLLTQTGQSNATGAFAIYKLNSNYSVGGRVIRVGSLDLAAGGTSLDMNISGGAWVGRGWYLAGVCSSVANVTFTCMSTDGIWPFSVTAIHDPVSENKLLRSSTAVSALADAFPTSGIESYLSMTRVNNKVPRLMFKV